MYLFYLSIFLKIYRTNSIQNKNENSFEANKIKRKKNSKYSY